jgi:phosphatidylglycerophosphate synthase
VRLLLLIPYVLLLQQAQYALAAATYLIAVVTDIDGTIARRMRTTTTFGSFYDPVVDGLFMVVALWLLASSGSVLWLPVIIYWCSAAIRLVPALMYLGKHRQVRTTLLSKTIAFSGFTSVLLGTLQVQHFITSTLLLIGAVANVILAMAWLRR